MKVVVSGGAGFIGSHVVDALRNRGDEAVCIDSLDPGVHHAAPEYLRRDVDYCFADLTTWLPDGRFEGVDAVVHLAALGGVGRASRQPARVLEANAGGTARLFEAARTWARLRRFVLISSFSVYGAGYSYRCRGCGTERNAERRIEAMRLGRFDVECIVCGAVCEVLPITEEARPDPIETYGASKYIQELCLRGLPQGQLAVLRLSSVYGPRLRLDDGEATIIAKLAGWIRAGESPRLFEDGGQLRDWVYVGDVVAAVLRVLDIEEAPALVNVCSGVGTSLTAACEILSQTFVQPYRAEVVGGFRPGDMRHCLGNPARLKALLGREPISFAQGAGLAFDEAAGRRGIEILR